MRIRLLHQTTHHFAPPARGIIQALRASPRDHEGQHVADWRIDVDCDCRLTQSEDAYGNIVQTFSLDGPVSAVTISVEGEIDTFDTAGVVRGAAEKFPLELYLRETALTRPDAAIRAFAARATDGAQGPLDALHRLMATIHRDIAYARSAPDSQPVGAAACLAAGAGDTRDIAHLYAACARALGHPARVAAGYHVDTGEAGLAQQRMWAEAYAGDIGWVAFDPAADLCPTETYVRVAAGLDWLDVAPARGAQASGALSETRHDLRLGGGAGGGTGQSQSQG
jgi:transglutaminase-like putative cysteine protease